MDVALEVEDDLIFADLSRQVSLLIMDDDDDFDTRTPYPSVSFQSRGDYHHVFPTQPPVVHDQGCRRKQSEGTGVFIPRSLPGGRRKQRSGRFSSVNTKSSYRQQDNNSRVVSHQGSAYGNSFNYSRQS